MPAPTSDLLRPRWSDRAFRFGSPLWMLADFTERLRGSVHRLGPLLSDLPDEPLRAKIEGSWSIIQNAGHLGDVEELWLQRVEDLKAGRPVYSPADASRFVRLAEAHQARSPAEVIRYLIERRAPFLEALDTASESLQRAEAFHERLKCRMRLVDFAQFVAEHDDHHLLRIRDIRRRLGFAAAV